MKCSLTKFYCLFFFLIGGAVSCIAQQTLVVTDTAAFNIVIHKFKTKWIDKEFPLIQEVKNIPGYTESQSTMIYMGFSGCHPCQYQLPFLLKFTKEKPNVTFVYLTFDSRATFEKELGRLHLHIEDLPNFYFVSVEKERIRQSKLDSFGYPVAYFLNKAGVIKAVEKAGWLTKKYNFFKKIWQEKLVLTQ